MAQKFTRETETTLARVIHSRSQARHHDSNGEKLRGAILAHAQYAILRYAKSQGQIVSQITICSIMKGIDNVFDILRLTGYSRHVGNVDEARHTRRLFWYGFTAKNEKRGVSCRMTLLRYISETAIIIARIWSIAMSYVRNNTPRGSRDSLFDTPVCFR